MSFSLKGRNAFITGASRGIGFEIAKALAARGANVTVAAKSATPHKLLPGTIHTAVDAINEIGETSGSGAKGLAVQLDVRDAQAVEEAIEQAASTFGGLDIVVNNASAINMKPTLEQSVKGYDLMNGINSRGTWLVSKFSLPHLLKSSSSNRNPHLLTLSPPLASLLDIHGGSWPEQFAQVSSAYTIAKLGMSLATLSLAAELRGKVGVNALWPYTMIGTSAMKVVSADPDNEEKRWRSPEIVSEAAARIFEQDGKTFNAQFLLDEVYLREEHGFTHEQIKAFSLGGADTPLSSLAEDLYISTQMRDDIARSRKGQD